MIKITRTSRYSRMIISELLLETWTCMCISLFTKLMRMDMECRYSWTRRRLRTSALNTWFRVLTGITPRILTRHKGMFTRIFKLLIVQKLIFYLIITTIMKKVIGSTLKMTTVTIKSYLNRGTDTVLFAQNLTTF